MENLSDALLIIDLQKGVCFDGETINHFSELITTVNLRIQRYREQNKLILFVQHCDEILVPHSETWEIVEELDRKPNDLILQKTHANSFTILIYKKIYSRKTSPAWKSAALKPSTALTLL